MVGIDTKIIITNKYNVEYNYIKNIKLILSKIVYILKLTFLLKY